MKKQFIAGVAAAAAILTALSGCAGASGDTSATSSKPVQGGDLVMARAAEPQTLIPWDAVDNASIWTLEEIYDTLLVPSKDGHDVKPALATSWTQSEDKLSWTFNLREGVKFSNGQPLTSADVKFSLDQARSEDSSFYFIDQVISAVDAPDANTVVVHTTAPWAPLPADIAAYGNSIVPNNFGGKTKAEFAEAPLGSGPFKLSSWDKGQSMKLVRNTNYWQSDKPYLDSVTFSVVADSNTRATQLQSGQAHINEFPAYSSLQALKGQSGVKVGRFAGSRVDYLTMNNTAKPFNDPNVRLAVAQAVDRDALIKGVLFGNGTPANSYLSPALWAYDASITPPAYNIEQAKADLAKSSVPEGFSTTLLVFSGSEDQATAAQLIQSSLAKIGIKVTITTLDPAAGSSAQNALNFDMSFTYQTTDIIDPDEIARYAGLNSGASHALFSGYANPKLEDLANEAVSDSDQGARIKKYSEMQQIINSANPYIPLYYTPSVFAFSNSVHGFNTLPTGNYDLVNTWMSKK